MSYDAYGRAWHRRPSDIKGDGVLDVTYVNDRFAAAACATIGTADYDPDLDFNRDGTVCDTVGDPDVALVADWLTAGGSAALPRGRVSETLAAAVAPTGQAAPDNPIAYAGHYFDPETGWYQMRNRAYSPELGRFVQRDPIGYADGMNMYQYVGSDPLSAYDPMGLAPVTWGELWGAFKAEMGYDNYWGNMGLAASEPRAVITDMQDTLAQRAINHEFNTSGGRIEDVTALGLARNIFLEQSTGVSDCIVAIEGVDLSAEMGEAHEVTGLDRAGAGFRGFGGVLSTGTGLYAPAQQFVTRFTSGLPMVAREFLQQPMRHLSGTFSRLLPSEARAASALRAMDNAGGGHGFSRHGAHVPTGRTLRRSVTGELPDKPCFIPLKNGQPAITDSSKFFNARRQAAAVKKGSPSGTDGWGYRPGERYPRFGSKTVVAPKTSFPHIGQGQMFGMPQHHRLLLPPILPPPLDP